MIGLSWTSPCSGIITTSSRSDRLIISGLEEERLDRIRVLVRVRDGCAMRFGLDMPSLPRITLGLGLNCLYPGLEGQLEP